MDAHNEWDFVLVTAFDGISRGVNPSGLGGCRFYIQVL